MNTKIKNNLRLDTTNQYFGNWTKIHRFGPHQLRKEEPLFYSNYNYSHLAETRFKWNHRTSHNGKAAEISHHTWARKMSVNEQF